jgi:glyoxylase-like metal-dependent hydrolase (beta-lactamase superfamily II)
MKKIATLSFILSLTISLLGQTIKVSDKLSLVQLTHRTYIHTCENSNGIVFINEGNALIASTPDSDVETQNLINWVINEKNAKIIGYVIDRWHPDAMEGLDIVHKNGIMTYSFELTRQIAKEKGLPIPQIGFDPKKEILVGNEKVICHFLGEAHTKDGIVVWIPSEQILFGGNEIRNFNGWVGNIGDASLDKWSETATRVKNEYGAAKIVVPGHGMHGGAELIDYTINLYKHCKKDSYIDSSENSLDPTYKTNDDFYIKAELDLAQDGKRILKNAVVIAQDSTKYVKIESEEIEYQPDNKRVDSDNGRLRIYDKTKSGEKLWTDIFYDKLIIFKQNDSIGLRVILKGFN